MLNNAPHSIEALARHPDISLARPGRRPGFARPAGKRTLATGYAPLDNALSGGWPQGALTELLVERPGQGETRLLAPMLRAVSATDGWIALVAPPYQPFPQAWAAAGVALERLLVVRPQDNGRHAGPALWALEQLLRSGAFATVLGWPRQIRSSQLRKLQLAAETGQSAGFLMRPASAARQHSSAALRLAVRPRLDAIDLQLIKCRARWASTTGKQQLTLPDPVAGC